MNPQDNRITIGDHDVTDWTPEQRAELQAEVDGLVSAMQEVEKTIASETARRSDPASVIKQAKLERERMTKVRDDLERATVERFALDALIAKHGRDRLSRLDTKGGMVVVRCPTEEEAFGQGVRVSGLPDLREKTQVGHDYLVSLCVHPAEPNEVRSIAARWPSLWADIDQAVSMLCSARAGDVAPLD